MTQTIPIQSYGDPPAHAHYVPATAYAGLVFASGQLPRLAEGTHTAGRTLRPKPSLTK